MFHEQLTLDFTAATQAKNAGMKLAEDNAGREWNDAADRYFEVFLKHDSKGEPFTCEKYRTFLQTQFPHFEKPPSERAFGGVIIRAKNRGLIEWIGRVPTKSVTAHCAVASLWKAKNNND